MDNEKETMVQPAEVEKKEDKYTWHDEKRFLDRIGCWGRVNPPKNVKPDKELLQKYLAALDLRSDNPDWIDKSRKYIDRLLAEK